MQLHFIVEEILHLGSPVPISKSLMHYARKPDQISHEGEMEPEARGAVRQGGGEKRPFMLEKNIGCL